MQVFEHQHERALGARGLDGALELVLHASTSHGDDVPAQLFDLRRARQIGHGQEPARRLAPKHGANCFPAIAQHLFGGFAQRPVDIPDA
ncbi:MAG: hypothetical protein ACREFI_00570, partial [Stellaceae bacterium]